MLVIRSLQTPTGWGLGNYRALSGVGREQCAGDPGDRRRSGYSLRTALVAAALSVLIGVLLSVVLARRPRRRVGPPGDRRPGRAW